MKPDNLYYSTIAKAESGVPTIVPRNYAAKKFVDLCGGASDVAGMSNVKVTELEKAFEFDGIYVESDSEIKEYVKATKDDQPEAGAESLPFVARYNTILTTSDRDREGDILRSKGAKIDKDMPNLWQHIPYMPIGRIIRVISQDEKQIEIRNGLSNVSMISDVLALMDTKCLRTSHGFRPIKYDSLRDDSGNYLGGYDFEEFAVMESSLVSVPANAGAFITQYEKNKFTHPLIKAMGRGLFESRATIVKGGWEGNKSSGGIQVTVHNHLPATTPAATPAAEPEVKTVTPTKTVTQEQIDAEKGKKTLSDAVSTALAAGGTVTTETILSDDGKSVIATVTKTVVPESTQSKTDAKKKDGDGGSDSGPGNTDKPKERSPDNPVTNQDEGTGPAKTTADKLSSDIRAVGRGEGVPVEARGRLNLSADMLDDVSKKFGEACDTLSEASKGRDVAGIVGGVSLCMSCGDMLPKIAEELQRAGGIEGLSDDAASVIAKAIQGVNDLMEMMQSAYEPDETPETDSNNQNSDAITGGNAPNDGNSDDGKALKEFQDMMAEDLSTAA